MSILRIYFSGQWLDSNSPCPWALLDASGNVLQSGNDPLAALPKGHECIGIVAAERVLSIEVTVPPGARRRWQSALPFMAEEHTLPDPESNHVIPGPTLPDGRVMLAVVDKLWLKRIIETCRLTKLSLRRMTPETFLPTISAGSWVLIWNGSSGFVRTGLLSGMAVDGDSPRSAPLALQLILNSARESAPKKIEIRFPYIVPEAQRVLPQWVDLPLALSIAPVWDWRHANIPENALNLLWGDFAPRAKVRDWWPKVRPAVLILVAVLGVELVGTNIEWALLANERSHLNQNMEKNFRAAFGSAGTLVNAPLQMQRNLAELRHAGGLPDDGDFLSLLDAAASALNQLSAGSVRAMHYETGRLDIEVMLGSKTDLQNLQQRLQSSGLGVKLDDAQTTGNGTKTRVALFAGIGS